MTPEEEQIAAEVSAKFLGRYHFAVRTVTVGVHTGEVCLLINGKPCTVGLGHQLRFVSRVNVQVGGHSIGINLTGDDLARAAVVIERFLEETICR